MKVDVYAEMYLWNRGFDRLIRVLERSAAFGIFSKERVKTFELRLEEIRAGLNADFAEAAAKRERADEERFFRQRTALDAGPGTGRLK